jgi:hypothetical protein
VKVLPESDVPSNITTFYLQGLSKASNAEFAALCSSQLGFLKSPVYGPWARSLPSKLAEVDQFAQTMLGQYQAMKVNGTWSGASHKASAFKATALVTATTKQQGGRKSFAEWWDEQICEVPNCGGKHPTKWHNDLGRRDRPNPSQRLGSNRRDRIQGRDGNRRQNSLPANTNSRGRNPRFKSPQAKNRFRQQVHQAALENFEEEDHDIFAHLAGNDDVDEDDVIEDAGDAAEAEVENEDADLQANAAISLDQLLNW